MTIVVDTSKGGPRPDQCFACNEGTEHQIGGPWTSYTFTGSKRVCTLLQCDTCGRVILDQHYYPQGEGAWSMSTRDTVNDSDRGQSLGPGPGYGDGMYQPLIDIVCRLGNLYAYQTIGDVQGRDPETIQRMVEAKMLALARSVVKSIEANPGWDQPITQEGQELVGK